MSSKASKKGRNPGVVDNWLDSIGLYRKNVAYDETCLFRAVSEQLFDCQIHHERVRRECVRYGRRNFMQFQHLLEDEEQWFDHMDLLEKHMVVCGNIEIQLISKMYQRNVMVFDAGKQQLLDMTKIIFDKNLMLCLMNEDHFDVVYKREHIWNAGFCQSIVYGILYEKVFDIANVQDIVQGMLYEKEFVGSSSLVEMNNNSLELKLNSSGDSSTHSANENNAMCDIKSVTFMSSSSMTTSSANPAPFPFKVAKALDPTIYRNIEYDAWTEVRREMRLGDWYYGDDNLILGTRCVLNDNDETYECYIQDIIKDENKCVVYVTKLAEKRTVNYTDLSPEDDAKPWPLPYRFSRNLAVSTTAGQSPGSNNNSSCNGDKPLLKLPRKRNKDKRRIKSASESSAQSHHNLGGAVGVGAGVPGGGNSHHHSENHNNLMEQDVNAYVGAPLQMQNTSNSSSSTTVEHHTFTTTTHNNNTIPESPQSSLTNPKTPEKSLSQHNLLVTPDVPSPMPKFTWEAPWSPGPAYVPVMSETVTWHHHHHHGSGGMVGTATGAGSPSLNHHAPPPNFVHFNNVVKPMVASAPVTPDLIPYHDTHYPFVYNYHVENYNQYNPWPPGTPTHAQITQPEYNTSSTTANGGTTQQNCQTSNGQQHDNSNGNNNCVAQDNTDAATSSTANSAEINNNNNNTSNNSSSNNNKDQYCNTNVAQDGVIIEQQQHTYHNTSYGTVCAETYDMAQQNSSENLHNHHHHQTMCASMPPASPTVEIYSPIIHIAPGTPVLYTHHPGAHTPEIAEMIMQGSAAHHHHHNHVPLYNTPPIDVQYMSTNPFIYPPTPPAAWYPPGMNSQGFIFPAPVNQNMSK